MSQSQEKRARKFLRRTLGPEVKKRADELAWIFGSNMKPKPAWIPTKIWIWMAGFFIKIKKPKDNGNTT